VSLAALSLALGALPFGAAQASSDDVSRPGAPLSKPMRGQRAIDALGTSLGDVARENGLSTARLRQLLTSDSTAWLTTGGRLFYQDLPAPAGTGNDVEAIAPFPVDQTFLLHSKPGSNRTIYIDVDGHNVSGTYWNTGGGQGLNVPDGDYPAWDPANNGAAFTDPEKEEVQSVWQRVAEDYAPFDVDVTTQDPGLAAIVRTNSADQIYGTRALVSPSPIAEAGICGPPPACGGVAFLDIFEDVEPDSSKLQPAWVFPHELGLNVLGGQGNTKNVAEAVTHEVGHNFALNHDGLVSGANQGTPCPASLTAYYCGHAMWAPIMGAGYYRPVTQWSKGEYATPSNTAEDDVAIIATHAAYRADEGGDTVATAGASNSGTKYVTTAADKDTFALGSCTGSLTINAATAILTNPSPNLDIQLELLGSGGAVLATDNPVSAMVSADTASGLSASVTSNLTTGTYFVRVDGVGNGTGVTGYTDYASIGAYRFTSSGAGTCAPEAPGAPSAVGNGAARSIQVSWTAPTNIGGTPSSYSVFVNGSLAKTTATPGATLTGLSLGTPYAVTISATNASGTSPVTSAGSVTLTDKPSAPTIGKAKSGKRGGKKTATFSWSAPTSNGGLALTGYVVQILKKGKVVKTINLAASKTSYKFKTKKNGKYKAVVSAVNALGAGAASAASKAVKAK
jgi:hypothetical protein